MSFKTPILFIVFNRPDTTSRVFDEIRKIKPSKLYIVADGPRIDKIGEKERCEEVRNIIDKVDWDCEVFKNYSDINLGCKKRVSSGIDWFFENVEEGIILEDDCLPSQSFFYYCQELLEKYKDNDQIAVISGNNFNLKKIGEGDYYFSRIPHIWGWATWRRSWKNYDINMHNYPSFRKEKNINKIWSNKRIQKYWTYIFDEVYKNNISTWDYQLSFSVFLNNKLCICPNTNLVSNIGFGESFTNTLILDKKVAELNRGEISLPLIHPEKIEYNEDNNKQIYKSYLKFFEIKKFLKFIGIFKIIRNTYLYIKK